MGRACSRSILLLVAILLSSRVAAAGTLNVTLGTGALSGTASVLAFDFIDGDGVVNNTVLLSNFSSDATFDPETSTGSVTGTLPGTVTFTDGEFFNELLAPATLAGSIAFTLDYTNVAGDLPDTFSVFLLDSIAVNSRVTTDLPGNALLQITLNGNGAGAVVLATSVDPAVTVVPEPSSLSLAALGASAMGALSILRRFA